MKVARALIAFLIVAPIWYYLLYQILVRVEASELMWFLYWVYLPFALIIGALEKIIEVSD